MLEEKTIPETTEAQEDAFLDGLLDGEDAHADEDMLSEADSSAENASEVTDTTEEADQGTTEQDTSLEGETNPNEEELFEVTYNGEKQNLPRSELIKLAQKGMNYDHVKGQLDSLKNSDVQKQIAQLAKEAGMEPSEYLSQVISNRNMRRAQELADAEGITPEIAKRLIDSEEEIARYKSEEETRAGQQQREAMIRAFIREYPEVTAADIPPEVWERANKTNDLISAYALHERDLLKTKLAEAESAIGRYRQNETNKQKAVGSVRGSKTAQTEDAFLSGLFGE